MALPDISHQTIGALWHEHNKTSRTWCNDEGSQFGRVLTPSEFSKHLTENKLTSIGHHTGRNGTIVQQKRTPGGLLVALKRLKHPSESVVDPDTRSEAWSKEVCLIRSLTHFHIIELIGSCKCDGMEQLILYPWATCSLNKLLEPFDDKRPTNLIKEGQKHHKWGPVPTFVASIMGCVANALSYIHSKNIRHKDIKPENILIAGARVYITDFDLAIKFDSESGSASGGEPTRKVTWMYASPEAVSPKNRDRRGRAQDIYSLACVFIEIFAVYKRRSAKDVVDQFDSGTHIYSKNMPKLLKWMGDLVSQRSDVQLLRLIRAMVNEKPKERPLAKQVWEELVTIQSKSSELKFCGACCMPMNSPQRETPDCAPHPLAHSLLQSNSKVAKSATNSSDFETQYNQEDRSPYSWNKYLRIDHSYILDSVLDRSSGNGSDNQELCRKTIAIRQPAQNTDHASLALRQLAQIEATILKTHKHLHIVAFSATYQDGDSLALLTTPVTEYDLRDYLSMVEFKQTKDSDPDWRSWTTILRNAPGCLASAVSFLHERGIVHGDISPENIIVTPNLRKGHIRLANFGRAAFIKYVKDLCMYVYGAPESKYLNQYAPSHTLISEAMDSSHDVFSLGCAYLEMETVRMKKKREDMWKLLLKDTSQRTNKENTVGNADTTSTNHKPDATPIPSPQPAKKEDTAHDGNGVDLEEGQDMNTEDDASTYSQLSGDVLYKEPNVLVNLHTWVLQLYENTSIKDRGTLEYGELIEEMVQQEPKKRPTAREVYKLTTKIKDESDLPMCGPNCISGAYLEPNNKV